MPEPWSRAIKCDDGAGRERVLRVILNETHDVVLLPPPGEGAVLKKPSAVQELRQALTDAQVESIHRRKSW